MSPQAQVQGDLGGNASAVPGSDAPVLELLDKMQKPRIVSRNDQERSLRSRAARTEEFGALRQDFKKGRCAVRCGVLA
jgi:hypothetical protein